MKTQKDKDLSARRLDHVRYEALLTQAERNITEIFNLNYDRYGKTKLKNLQKALRNLSLARSALDSCACVDGVDDPTRIYYGKTATSQQSASELAARAIVEAEGARARRFLEYAAEHEAAKLAIQSSCAP